jgi:cytochrome c-type biogenesis protein CcmH/NrfG
MMNNMRIALVIAACCLLALAGCGGGAPATANQSETPASRTATTNSVTTQTASSTPVAAASPKPATPAAGGGEPVDTSKYDAQIKRLEEKAKKSPTDKQARVALGKAYTERGDALTGVRQYRAALGDYRRALRNDPDNEQAQQMAGTIISILKSMGRDVPPEGQEPPPLPLKQ